MVSQDYDPLNASFSDLKTYAFSKVPADEKEGLLADDPLLDKRIFSAVDKFLSEKGYIRDNTGKPDFFVIYKYSVKNRIETDRVRTSVGFGVGGYGRYGGIGVGTGDTIREYDEGRLVIDFKDRDKKNLIWRGIATSPLISHSTPEEKIELVNEAVFKILDQFPPETR